MTKTFAERCHIAQQFLPDAQYKAMLTALHTEMLAKLAEQLAPAAPVQQEPFGYFKAEPFGWTDCAETDDGAIALYTTPQAQPAQRKPLTLQELEAAWNAQAGHMNQWNALCLDEMVAWAQTHNIKENT